MRYVDQETQRQEGNASHHGIGGDVWVDFFVDPGREILLGDCLDFNEAVLYLLVQVVHTN